MQTKTSIFFLLSLILIFNGSFYSASGQNLSAISDYSIKLAITPSHLESGIKSHPVGFVYVLNQNGVPIQSSHDVDVYLISDNPEIASVPEYVTLKANQEHVQFDVTTGNVIGETTISASYDGKSSFTKIQIGVGKEHLSDELILELGLPTENMHVNSKMPFSVYLKTLDGKVIRAPYDIEIVLEHEDSMATPDSETLIIKKGQYYAWGLLESHNKVGNTFLRAIHNESGLDTAKSINISSTLPTSLQVSVFPKLITAEIEREVDIFVSVLDSNGNPTKSHKDIPLEFFSNVQYPIGDSLDSMMKSEKPMIKKGEFGLYLKQKFHLQNLLKNDIMIGVSAPGFGTSTDTFRTVGKAIEMGDTIKRTLNNKVDFGFDVKDYESAVQLFGLERIPSNATVTFTYQLSIIEDDEDDDGIAPDGSTVEIHPDCLSSDSDLFTSNEDVEHNMGLEFEKRILFTIDCLDNEGMYPLQSNEHQYSDGYVKRINVISSDSSLANISDSGNIKKASSIGTATITTGQKSGPVVISASVNGVGTGSFVTNVVNSLEQKEVRIFSPVGEDLILFDRNGYFDIFLVSLDGNSRPKIMQENSKYLVTPTNGLVEIKKDSTFTFVQLRSDSFSIEQDKEIELSITPIGENTDQSLISSKKFLTQPSSQMKVYFPNEHLNVNHQNDVGIAQIVDMQGNPVVPTTEIKAKISSSNTAVAQTNVDVSIPQNRSYAIFPILTDGGIGESVVTASAKGVIPNTSTLNTATSDVKLNIFTGGFEEQIPVDEPIELKFYVDDENAKTISGALVRVIPDENATVSPDTVRTASDGSATFSVMAKHGPSVSLNILATAEGYVDGEDTLIINVDEPESSLSPIDIEFPEWVIYVVIFGFVLVGVLVALFLRKSKSNIEEEWEEEEI